MSDPVESIMVVDALTFVRHNNSTRAADVMRAILFLYVKLF